MKLFLKYFLMISVCCNGFAQTYFDQAKLNHYFDELEKNNRFMGNVAVSKDGQIIYSRAIGFSDIASQRRADENSKYRIGSITKTFTAVLVLKAVEDKKLKLEQTIEKWFPNIKNAEKITIEYLLNHRSGIGNFTADKDYFTWNTQAKSQQQMLEIIAGKGSDFQPNAKAEYSNSNYWLLTYILEKVYKTSYLELLKKHIFRPLGLMHTSIFEKINLADNQCLSYKFRGDWALDKQTDVSITKGAGAISSVTTDLIKFAEALFGGKLLKSESLQKMKTLQDGYGLGLFGIPFYERKSYGHTGGIDGFSSIFSHFPEDKITYVLLSNGLNYNMNDISIAVMSAVYNKPYEIPIFSKYDVTDEELETYVGTYYASEIHFRIHITREGQTLKAQGTGQPAFVLEATQKNIFKFDAAGVKMEFNPQKNTMILTQGGVSLEFKKE